MLDFLKQYWLTGVLICLAVVYYFTQFETQPLVIEDGHDKEASTPIIQTQLFVTIHCAGAILNPGVYTIPMSLTVLEAIEYCGGFLNHADLDKVNLAKKVKDGQRIFVPFLKKPTLKKASIVQPVFINSANASTLELIPGVGKRIAEAIVLYRNQHGLFKRYDDLLEVKYIGKGMLKKIKPYIRLD